MTETESSVSEDPLEIARGIIRGGVSNLYTKLLEYTKELPDGQDLLDIDPIKALTDLTGIIDKAHEDILKRTSTGKGFDEITKSQSVTLDKLTHLIDTKIEYVIEPICPRATLTLVQGMPKGGKSTFSLWLALCASLGCWPGEIFIIRKPHKTLFVEFEDSPILVAKRSARYLAGAGWDGYALPETFTLCDSPQLWLDSPTYEAALIQEIQAKGYEFIVIDTLSYVHNCEDENSSAQMKLVTAALKRIVKASNCSIIMIHHAKKGSSEASISEKARGSSAIAAAADVILDWGDRKGTDITPVQVVSKYDDGVNFTVEYKRNENGILWILAPEESETDNTRGTVMKTLRDAIVGLPDGVPASHMVKLLGQLEISRPTTQRHLNRLFQDKEIDRKMVGNQFFYSLFHGQNGSSQNIVS